MEFFWKRYQSMNEPLGWHHFDFECRKLTSVVMGGAKLTKISLSDPKLH